jgi:hypothetical protein
MSELSIVAVSGWHSQVLDASVRRLAIELSAPSHAHWIIRAPGMRRKVIVDLSAEWLSISVPLRLLSMPINLKIIGSMLSRNALIDGSSRIIGNRLQGRRQIVADIPTDIVPWDCEADLDALVEGTIADLYAVLNQEMQHIDPPSQAGLPREQIEAIFDAAGWPAQPGEGDELEIPLEVHGNYLAANVCQDSSSTQLTVPILAGQLAAAPYMCRQAVTVLLWLTSSRIRMVRATRSRQALALEVSLLSAQVDAVALAHACTALSAALQQFVAEAGLLIADEDLARIYLGKLQFQSRHEASAPHADVQDRLNKQQKETVNE